MTTEEGGEGPQIAVAVYLAEMRFCEQPNSTRRLRWWARRSWGFLRQARARILPPIRWSRFNLRRLFVVRQMYRSPDTLVCQGCWESPLP
jgi:hypothetical protein